jgi:hypothetical protein
MHDAAVRDGAAAGADRRVSWLPLALALLAAALAAAEGAQLYRLYLAQDRLPQWDMAGHAWGGIELHRAIRHGEPLRFLQLLNRQDKWPFGFSLLLLPFLALGHDGFAAATLLSVVLFALTPPLLVWAAFEVERGAVGTWAAVLAVLLFLSSPLLRLFAVLVMREEAGVFFSLLALCTYLRARRTDTGWAWRSAGLAGLALFLVKYNYALIWGSAVAADAVLRLSAEDRAALARRIGLRLWPWRVPGATRLARVTAIFLDLLILCLVVGVNAGYLVYAGILGATFVWVRRWIRDPGAVKASWQRLPTAARALLATIVLPLWTWFLSPWPVHPKEILAFLRNRQTGPPLLSLESLLYYPHVFLADYALAPLGPAILALATLAVVLVFVRGRTAGGEAGRVLVLAAALSFLLPTLHVYKQGRFLATAAPFVLLVAAVQASRMAHALPAGPWRAAVGAVLCAAAAAGIVTVAEGSDLSGRLVRDYPLYSADAAFAAPLEAIAVAGRGSRRLAVVGSFNELSENLIRCRLAQEEGPEGVRPLSRFPADLPRDKVRARLAEWLAEERPDRIVALRPLTGSPILADPDYRGYNAWQLTAIAALDADPTMRSIGRQGFPATKLEVLVFAPRATELASSGRILERGRR